MDQPNNNVKAIFIAALDHEAGPDRAAYLDAACAGNAELKRRVEALLAAHERADEVLGRPDQPVTTDPNASRPITEATSGELAKHEFSSSEASITAGYQEPARPNVLIAGRYLLQQKIGEGGMGEVWVAKQTEPVKRKVALKLIKTGMDSRAVLARFEQERQALAMMDHPNIARVLDGGLTPGGQPFFVMELVNGLPLTKFCDEARLTPRERLELFVPVCQAVQHAHQKGIVHRDLKPANILVTLIDGKPIPKVIDFGVAKATAGRLTDHSMSTQFGAVIGTLEYMSPEQAGFSAVDIDTRADIYSLGVILYELLTGLRPIDARRLENAALTEMIRMIREEEPSKPSTRLATDESLPSLAALRQTEPRKLMALLRGELDSVVMKCLEKSRERRYETANALSRDVQRHLADEPVEARPPTAGYRLSKFLTRHRGAVIAAALVVAALLAGIAGTTFGLIRGAPANRGDETKGHRGEGGAEAAAQKKIADTQKRLAIGNASNAGENARKAELRLAEGLISQADAWSLAGRFAEAHSLYTEAYDKFAELKAPLLAAEVGLWSSYRQAGFPLLTFTGSSAGVSEVVITPDGRTALSADGASTFRLWDLPSGKILSVFPGHQGAVQSLAIASDGRIALSGGRDKTLKLWDIVTGKKLRDFTGHSDWVMSGAFAPDRRTAISGSIDNTLKLWDLVSGKELRTFSGHSSWVYSVAISSDGGTALSGSRDKTLKLWDLANGQEVRTYTGHTGPVLRVAFAPDGKTALSASEDQTVRFWDLATGKALRAFTLPDGEIYSVRIARDGKTALFGRKDSMLNLWDLTRGIKLRTFVGHADEVTSIAIAPDGKTAISGGDDNTLMLWDLVSSKEPRSFEGHAAEVCGAAITPNGKTALSASVDKTLRLWDLATGKELRILTGHAHRVLCVATAPDGRTALSGSSDSTLKLWDLATGEKLRDFVGHSGYVLSVAFSPDGQTAISGSSDNTSKLWNLVTGKVLRTLSGHSSWVYGVAISPDGQTALSGSVDSSLKLWDFGSGKLLRTFAGPDVRYQNERTWTGSTVAFAPASRMALSGNMGKTLTLWDVGSGQEVTTLRGHSGRVTAVSSSPDGRIVMSASVDGTLKLWDLAAEKSCVR